MISRVFLFVIPVLILINSCASSQEKPFEPENYSNLVQLAAPEAERIVESAVYVDSARVMQYKNQSTLLVMGSFPDGCTNIGKASHQLANQHIYLKLEGWRNPENMCTQALVSFSFLYTDIPEQPLQQADSIRINDITFPLN